MRLLFRGEEDAERRRREPKNAEFKNAEFAKFAELAICKIFNVKSAAMRYRANVLPYCRVPPH